LIIKNHKLFRDEDTPILFVRSPNQGGTINPLFLIMHYTAGASAESSIDTLTNPANKVSAHLVVGRDGSVTQLVDFNKRANHAGVSRWANLSGLNNHSIGVELDNTGRLEQAQDGSWKTWFGRTIPEDEVLVGTHKNEKTPVGWHMYSDIQIEAAVEIGKVLVDKYDLLDVLAHEDISPFRKSDTGFAFNMLSYRARIMGREVDEATVYKTAKACNIRSGPGTEHSKLTTKLLPKGTKVEFVSTQKGWMFVDVIDEPVGEPDLEGWIFGKLLELT